MNKFALKKSIESIYPDHKRTIKKLLRRLNLEKSEMKRVRLAYKNKDYITACSALVDYYRSYRNDDVCKYKPLHPIEEDENLLDDIFNDTFTFQRVRHKIPRKSNGHLDWGCRGPNNDREFGFFLNRQKYLYRLYFAYKRTQDDKYVERFNYIMQDWLISNPKPFLYRSSVQWRTLEVALRIMIAWTFTFFGFQKSKAFSPATRILMLASVYDHAEYCRKHVVKRGNIRVMILNALGTIAAFWPEFKKSDYWMKTAIEKMTHELLYEQVYDEGPQKELTNHYHSVALVNFEHFAENLQKHPGKHHLPPQYIKKLEKMWNYYTYNMRPNGYGLLNNDADYDYTRNRIVDASERFNRKDWLYIATNGSDGEKPSKSSVVFPKAGHLIMRNNWKEDAEWSFFDFGPWGTGHRHYDKLHLSIHAHGKDLLVDSGRYWYKGGIWRDYFRGTSSHNTITINEKRQKRYQDQREDIKSGENFYIGSDYDYGIGVFDGGYQLIPNSPTHRRAVLYKHNEYWLVVDLIETNNEHEVTANWHFGMDLNIEISDNRVKSTNADSPNIMITPSANIAWKTTLIKGQTEPKIQGWYSREYNHKTPNFCAEFTANLATNTIFAWLITINPKKPVNKTLDLSIKQISDFSAEILIQDSGDTNSKGAEIILIDFSNAKIELQS